MAYAPLRRQLSEQHVPICRRPQSEGSPNPISLSSNEACESLNANSRELCSTMDRRHVLIGLDSSCSNSIAPQRRKSEPFPEADFERPTCRETKPLKAESKTMGPAQDNVWASYDVDEVMEILGAQTDRPLDNQGLWRGGWKSGGIRSLQEPTAHNILLNHQLPYGQPPAGKGSPLVGGRGPTSINLQNPIKQRHRSADGRIS